MAVSVGLALSACASSSPPGTERAGLVAESTSTTSTTGGTTGPPADEGFVDGPFPVGVRTESFVDADRTTAANGGAPEQPDRTLETTVVYPAAAGVQGGEPVPDAAPAVGDGPFPLVVFAHGFTGNGPAYRPLLDRWAAAGYVVAAPTFPLSSSGAPGGPALGDYVSQPADVSFVLDEMLRLGGSGGVYDGLIDAERIGASGHSLGAITTIGLAFNSCCQDDRIDAYVPISGTQLPFGEGSFSFEGDDPVLFVHGDADDTVPFEGSQSAFDDAGAGSALLTLVDGPHIPFYSGPWPEVLAEAPVDFFDHHLLGRPGALDRLRDDADIAGISRLEVAPVG